MPTTPALGARDRVAAQRQSLVTINGLPGKWATKTGGETTAETTDVFDGGRTGAEKLAGPATTGNITVGRPNRPSRDTDLGIILAAGVGRLRYTITVQPTDADLVPQGRATTYANALLVRYTPPEVDAASSDPGRIELEFAVENLG